MSTHQEHLTQITDLAHRLVDIVSEQQTHLVGLQALMSAYVSVAVCHPCCARQAAATARQVAALIETHAAPAGAPHVH